MRKKDFKYNEVPDLKTLKEIMYYARTWRKADDPLATYLKDGKLCVKIITDGIKEVEALGSALFAHGLRDCEIALMGENSFDWCLSYFAVVNGKNRIVPLDQALPEDELAELIKRAHCRAFIYSNEYINEVNVIREQLRDEDIIFINMNEFDALLKEGEELIASGFTDFIDTTPEPDDLAAVVFTSGTTGRQKGVLLTHRNICVAALIEAKVYPHLEYAILILPLYHTLSWVAGMFPVMLFCDNGYLCPNIKNLQQTFKEHRPETFGAVPYAIDLMYKMIWDSAGKMDKATLLKKAIKISNSLRRIGIDLRHVIFRQVHEQMGGRLKVIYCGGAPLDKRIQKELDDMGIYVRVAYGMTECAPGICGELLNDYRFGSVGRAFFLDLRIDAPNTDGVGEVQVRGPNVMRGYLDDEEATRAAFTEDGWLKTGDLGYKDGDGFLFITGRIKNLILTGSGENVSPEWLEEKLYEIPGAAEVLVYQEGGLITAEIYPDPEDAGAAERLPGAVDELNRRLPIYAQIARTKLRSEEFPRTTTMKIERLGFGD